jgi:hypothetical protein
MLLTEERLKGFCKGILARAELGLHNSLLIHDASSLSLLSVKQIAYHKSSPNINTQIDFCINTTIINDN